MNSRHLSNAEQMLFSTAYIEVLCEEGLSMGIGFFAQFEMPNGKNAVALVSCRHLLENAASVKFWSHIQGEGGRLSGRFVEATIKLEGRATLHPNPDIILPALSFTMSINTSCNRESDFFTYRSPKI